MDTRTAILFSRTLPFISRIRDSYEHIAKALSIITGYCFAISLHKKMAGIKISTPRLKAMKLGVNAMLKGDYTEEYATVEVEAPRKVIREMLPQARQRTIIDSLLEIFMPEDIPYKVVLKPQPDSYSSRIGDKLHPCILGVNARLNEKNNIYGGSKQ
jgi:hypothetical protein